MPMGFGWPPPPPRDTEQERRNLKAFIASPKFPFHPHQTLAQLGFPETNAEGKQREIWLHERPVNYLRPTNETKTRVHRALQIGCYYHEISKHPTSWNAQFPPHMVYKIGHGGGWGVRTPSLLGMTFKTDSQITDLCEWTL
jgi:hypothetical protein